MAVEIAVPKNIIIFSDGTGQAGGLTFDERRSNIYKLYRATRVGPDSRIKPSQQVAYYDAGLGSRPPGGGLIKTLFRMAQNSLSGATGFGLTTNIIDCYEMIIRLWRPGDRIFLFGFSRGAYTARCVAGVLAKCGVPTRLESGAAMKYDAGTAHRLVKTAVKKVYQHTASVPRDKATARENELMDQRDELARQFCETYASRQQDKSEYPYFIGVFDTVASIASKGSLIILLAAVVVLAAMITTAFFVFYPYLASWLGGTVSGFLACAAGVIHFDPSSWWHWFFAVAGGFILIAFGWYVTQQVKFAPAADPKKPWRTLNISFGRMSFEDKTLNDNVRYARHAISIDENRASFTRVGWGDPKSTRPYKDKQGIETFQQYWFAGDHSDVGGSYPENESRLSDNALAWMVKAAAKIKNGLKIDGSVLQLYPSADGMQHDERKVGFPILTKWFHLTWREKLRKIPGPITTLDESVYKRFKLPAVLQGDLMARYRPETLRKHKRLARDYKNIPEPKEQKGLLGYIRSFFLTF
jgi:uncharacterized protein (DUF2235 family)